MASSWLLKYKMNCEAGEMMPLSASMVTESPQPLPLTTSNSSRCTSPMSPPSDQNGSSSNEDELISGVNLTMNKSTSSKQQPSQQQTIQQHVSVSKRPSSHLNHDLIDYRHKMKMSNMNNEFSNISAYPKTNKMYRYQAAATDCYNNLAGISPELTQILLEYRFVLLDILTKSITWNNNFDEEQDDLLHRGIVLPNKCKCGYTSELSNHITRSSTYVHQLELKYRALVETGKIAADPNRYTPKRPTFINAAHASYPIGTGRTSLLEKKKKPRILMDKQPISIFSGNSSINSSLNDEDEDIDSEDANDVNEENIVANLNAPIYLNGSLDENGNNGGKTILEGYLESMKNPPSDEGSEEDGKEEEADDCNGPFGDKDDLPKGKRIDIKTKKMVIQMQLNGASFTDISRQFGISRKSVRRIISNYKTFGSLEKKRDSQKGPANGLNAVAVNGVNGLVGMTDSYPDAVDDDLGEEREMIVDESAMDDEDDADLDDDDDNVQPDVSLKNEMEPNIINSFTLYPRVPQQQQHSSHVNSHHSLHHNSYHHQMNKSKRNLSLIQSYNGGSGSGAYSQNIKHSQYQSNNHNGIANNRLSLIKPMDRYKPYDAKIRNSGNNNEFNSQLSHRMSKSHPIVPPLPMSTNIYPVQPRAHVKMFNNSSNNDHNNNNRNHFSNNNINDREMRNKNKNRHSIDMSFKESMIIPETDKNNNTQLSNCNVTITSTSSGKSNNEVSSNLPPIPASLADGNSDSEANLVPKTFMDGFPTGIMNSLNPNRATKLTLEDFNVVWQLRSQHWTHNQIRKYFQQRGKSISKSSISRIMNGKQRNFQQFFTVVPSGSNF